MINNLNGNLNLLFAILVRQSSILLMKLTLQQPFLSIVDLPEIELPAFTLLTGVNGAGKTHLLKALKSGAIRADLAPDPAIDIRMFDWSDLSPKDEGEFDSATLRQEQVQLYNQIKGLLQQPWGIQQITTTAVQYFSGPRVKDLEWLEHATATELEAEAKQGVSNGQSIRQSLTNVFNNVRNSLYNHLQPNLRVQLASLIEITGKDILYFEYEDYLRESKPSWGQVELFKQSFARLFVAYRDLYQTNQLAQFGKAKGDDKAPALSDVEFNKQFGSPPWDFVNSSLQAAGMDFNIDAPSIYNFAPYKPRLRKKGSNAEITFDGLSSGERVLMSFAFAVYYASDTRQVISKPKLLLLDEVDAPLHPSMAKNLLSTIRQVLVEQQKLSVMLTTHSPTTVALADEESVYVMRPRHSGVFKV